MSLSFPTSPAVGQVFQNWKWSGASWDPAVTAGAVVNYQVTAFLAAGAATFTTPPDSTTATVYRIRMVGGGGAGGGIAPGSGGQVWDGGNGGAGQYKELIITGQAPNSAWPITVGAAGATGAAGANIAGSGGATSLTIGGQAIVCAGGAGGQNGNYSALGGLGGSGGATPTIAGLTTVLNLAGQSGSVGNAAVPTGGGPNTLLGYGGIIRTQTGTAFDAPLAPIGYGAGGASAAQIGITGSAGGPGAVIIERIAG